MKAIDHNRFTQRRPAREGMPAWGWCSAAEPRHGRQVSAECRDGGSDSRPPLQDCCYMIDAGSPRRQGAGRNGADSTSITAAPNVKPLNTNQSWATSK